MKKDLWSKEFHKLVTLGESTTAGGWSSNRNRCWASRLAALISDVQSHPPELFNAGIGANVISTRSPCYEHSGKPAATERLEKHVIARAKQCLFVDVLAACDDAPWLVHFDGVHANDIGHLVVSNRIFETLVQNGSGPAIRTKQQEKEIPPWRDESSLAADYGYSRGSIAAPKPMAES